MAGAGTEVGAGRLTLRDYQWDGISWLTFLRRTALCGVLADEMGLHARLVQFRPTPEDYAAGYSYNASIWIALGRDEAQLLKLVSASQNSESWRQLAGSEDIVGWTDSFASILPVLKPLR
jgi:hypothetical protein